MKTKLFFNHTAGSHAKNEDFWVTVALDTSNQGVNAVEGKVVIDSLFTIKEIKEGDSNIVFWVEKPIVAQNEISFSGIVPGGINSNNVHIFSFLLNAKEMGAGDISARAIRVLQHDGKGSVLENTVMPIQIQIAQNATSSTVEIIDTEKPESFIPLVSKNENLFEGKNFVVFSTQDKISGIKEYQVKEGYWGTFTTAESPYELKYQNLDHTIYIKAVDKKGNERIVTVPAQHMSSFEIGIILIIGLLGVVLLVSKIWKRISLRF